MVDLFRSLIIYLKYSSPRIFVLVFLMAVSYTSFGATYYSRVPAFIFAAAGNNWSLYPGPGGALVAYPGPTHSYIIQTGNTVTLGANQTAVAITVKNGGILTLSNNRTLSLTNPLIIENGGTLSLLTRTLTLAASSIENSGSITGSTGRISRTSGTFTNTATGTVTMSGTASYIMGTGNFINNNTSSSVNFGSGAITVSGNAANQLIGGFKSTGRFTVSKTVGITTLTGDINSNGITKSGGSTLNMGAGLTHTTTGTVILTAGTMNGGSSTINVNVTSASAWSGASATVFVPETSTVNFGGVAQTLSATGIRTFYNITLSNSGVKSISNTTVNNILSIEGNATASVAPTYGPSATLRYNTATSRTVGAEWLATFVATGGVIIDNTGVITTNGNKVFDLDSPLTIIVGATLTPDAGHTFSFGGDLINDGTWTPSTGDVTITDTRDPQSIGSFSTSGLVSMTKSSGIATFIGNINGGALAINGAGILRLGFGLDHIITGDWTNTNGTLRGNTSTLHIGGNGSATAGDFRQNTCTVDFNGSGAQNIPAFTYYLLTTSTGGTKTLLGNTEVSNILTVGASTTLALGANTLDISGDGSPLVVTGTFDKGTSTVNFSSALSTNIPALNYYNLDGTGGDRTLANTGTIGIENTFTPGAGTYTVTNSTVNFNGSTAQTIPAFTFYKLILSNSNDKTIQNATNVTVNELEVQDTAVLNILGTGLINIGN